MSVRAQDLRGEVGNSPFFYRDAKFATDAAKILPADYYVTDRDIALVTVLGSCVAACVRDPLAKIGGLNHFMLPDGSSSDTDSAPARYGSFAMELLINALLKRGAKRERLEAKVFGGANVLKSFTTNQVGSRNAEFVTRYLEAEHIRVLADDLGGIHPRKVWFFPMQGRVVVQKLPHAHDAEVVQEERALRAVLSKAPVAGAVELFQ